jgi:serine phosphatase RsbU (regulator of sigma subunit)/anti-sigma regulatory factor (Ser/Thr protein kinase)/transposase
MLGRPIKESLVTFQAQESQIRAIKSYVESVCKETALPDRDVDAILLAIEEACTNVIRHAYLYGPGTIKLQITLTRKAISFTVIDSGRTFDFDAAGLPDLDRYVETGRKGGLGVYLIRKVMDEVSYRAIAGENHLRMVKLLPKPARVSLPKTSGMSIRVKFSLWTGATLLLIVVAAYLYFDSRTKYAITSDFITDVLDLSATIASQTGPLVVNKRSDPEFDELAISFKNENRQVVYVIITDGAGRIVANTEDPGSIYTQYRPPPGIDIGKLDVVQRAVFSSRAIYHVVSPVFPDVPSLGYVHLGASDELSHEEIASSRRSILLFAILSFAGGLAAIYVLANYFVKPIQRITEGVRKMGTTDVDEPLPVDGVDEFSAIAQAFNEMKVKIKEAQKDEVEKERIRKEMQVAQEIQQTLLPKQFPEIEGYDIATIYRAAKDVGGDYFDFVWIDEDTLGIIVADVSGKGVPGSLVMTMIRTAMRLEARGNKSAVDILSRVNEFITDDVKRGMFITIFLVVLDSKNRTISFASAGHNPMILYRQEENKTYFLNPRGIPVGINLPEGMSFEDTISSESVKLKKDDILVIYTDGITEAMNPEREQYGMERFLRFTKEHARLTPDEFTEKLDEDILSFTNGAEQNDDITLVAIKEQIMVDAYLLARRKKLLDLVGSDGKSIKEACEEMGVSTSTYYKYKRRFDLYGEEGLLNRQLRIDSAPRMLSIEERRSLLRALREHPEFGTARLKAELEAEKYGAIIVDEKALYDELVRLRLNTKRLRLEYVARQGRSLTEEEQDLLVKEQVKFQRKVEHDRQAYLEKIKAASGDAGNGKKRLLPQLLERLSGAGLPEEDIKQLFDAAEHDEAAVETEQVLKLFEKLSTRAYQIEETQPGRRVLDQSRFKDVDLSAWKRTEQTGIDLNSLDNEEENSTFDFDEYAEKLHPRGDRSDEDA